MVDYQTELQIVEGGGFEWYWVFAQNKFLAPESRIRPPVRCSLSLAWDVRRTDKGTHTHTHTHTYLHFMDPVLCQTDYKMWNKS
jgi:hypothetical protein